MKPTSLLLIVGLLSLVIIATSCSGDALPLMPAPEDATAVPTPIGQGRRGQALILNYGCGACHTISGIPGADNHVAPPLNNFAERRYIAGVVINTPENLLAWIQNPRGVQPDTAMPNLGVTETDARDIAAYLYGLP